MRVSNAHAQRALQIPCSFLEIKECQVKSLRCAQGKLFARRQGIIFKFPISSYSLMEPNGGVRSVNYVADPWNGFQAIVHTKGWHPPTKQVVHTKGQGWDHTQAHCKGHNHGHNQVNQGWGQNQGHY